jgi:hypothetical protein
MKPRIKTKSSVDASVERRLTGRTISSQNLYKRIEEGEIVRLALKGEVIAAGGNELVFISRTRVTEKQIRTQTYHLTGKWFLTKSSQLRFKTSIAGKVLRFEGVWALNKNQELIYKIERRQLKRSVVKFQTLVFKGSWDIDAKLRLRYQLAVSRDYFELNGKIACLDTVKGRAVIRFEFGIGYRRKISNPKYSILVLNGFWRPISKAEIGFEIKLKDEKPYLIRMRGIYRLTSKDSVEFRITKQTFPARPELSVIFSRELLSKKGELFIKGETDFNKDHFLGVGGRVRW